MVGSAQRWAGVRPWEDGNGADPEPGSLVEPGVFRGLRAHWRVVVVALAVAALPLPRAVAWARSPAAAESSQGAAVDLNTASVAELRALPGMGDAYVRRIIAGRPYTAKNQLVTRGVLPQAAYERIRDLVVAHRQRGTAEEKQK